MHKNQFISSKGQYIFQEGTSVFGVYVVQNGHVKIVSSNNAGKSQIVRLASTGHLIGHRGYGGEIYPIGAVSLSDSKICFLENHLLMKVFKAEFDFIYGVMMYYSTELRKSEYRTRLFAQMSVEEKVIFSIVYILKTFHKDLDGDLTFDLSRQDIADISGTNPSQVSRVFSFLRDKNLIAIHKNIIKVFDFNKLRQLIDVHDSYEF